MVIYVNYNIILKIIDLFAYSPHNIYTQETPILSLVWEDPLEKEMATHSSILAWEIPWTEEPNSKILYIYISGGQTQRQKEKEQNRKIKDIQLCKV